MSDGVGLSIGATRLAAVVVGRAALTRSSVLTRFPHRPAEVGVPSENPNLNERGLILTDFVDRVGDPVGIVAADGSTHLADGVLADALRALLLTLTGGRPPVGPVAVSYPAHWRQTAVEGLRSALAAVPLFGNPGPVTLHSDATAALTSLQDDPGVPTRGVIALCDFGGTGTSITLLDADAGYAPLAPTVRHTDLSGDLVDQALLTHVINDLSAAGSIDLSGTSAIGSLTALRAQCRGAKERLSTDSVTSLMADVPGHRGEVRLTRNELDDAIRQPVADFAGVLQDTLQRNGVRELAAVASVGGGARIPIVTTTMSEHFRVPVITHGQPELTAAIGAGLTAVRGTVEDGQTAVGAAASSAAAATAMAPELAAPADEMAPSGEFGALAWSDAADVPEVEPTDPYDYDSPSESGAVDDVRPQIAFQRDPHDDERAARSLPWYRRPEVAMGAGVLVVLAALAAAVVFVMRTGDTPPAPTTAPAAPSTTSAAPPPPSETQTPAPEIITQEAPPPPVTETVTAPPPEPAPTSPPPSEPPPPTTEPPPPTTTQPPPSTPPPPPTIPTLPYETIPGLPFVPNPIQPPQPAP
ncbi:Hsp70 family protein [Mycolicibacterium tusciae]|uniref:Hsp70 family protein n=1 Tax=Mycolicibacterium tusciae TaxID=75922 RepID=UPI000488B916|nr:Hsp70 family protein [Mycolicibacterium tusciae]